MSWDCLKTRMRLELGLSGNILGISGTMRDGPGNKHHSAMVTKIKIDALKTNGKNEKKSRILHQNSNYI